MQDNKSFGMASYYEPHLFQGHDDFDFGIDLEAIGTYQIVVYCYTYNGRETKEFINSLKFILPCLRSDLPVSSTSQL